MLYDISLSVDRRLPVWPGDPPIEIERFLDMDRGDPVNASRISFSAHTGTHVDAPRHHLRDGAGTDRIPLDALIGPAVVADLTGVDRIDAHELDALRLDGRVRRLLCKTRNSGHWTRHDGTFRRDFVAVAPDGAEWLVQRGIRFVGVDYLSVQRFGDPTPATHVTLLRAGVAVLEAADLSAVPPGPYYLICLPIKLTDLDGAPARAILVDDIRNLPRR